MAKRRTKDPDAPPPDPAVKHAVDLFHDEFFARFGFKPDPREFGRFAKEVKALLQAWGEADVLSTIRKFFTTTDPRVVRCDYKPMDFIQLAQHVRLSRFRIDARTAENIDAALRATGRL